MNLGIFLSSGDSLKNMEASGQRSRFVDYYLKAYAKNFSKVYLFSYADEAAKDLPKNVVLVPNRYNLHRFIYGLLLPFINYRIVKKCDTFRVFHLLGTLPAIISAVFLKKKYIFNYAYDYFKFTRVEGKNFQLGLLRLIFPLAKMTAFKIIAANLSVQTMLPMDKTVYIPNGVDTKIFKVKKNKVKKRDLKILSIGRLENQKNYTSLIKGLDGLKATLTLVGKGSLRDQLEDLSRQENVRLTIIDKIDNLMLPKFYTNYDIFILPSLIEGSPKVLLEAMACGICVVVSKVEGNKDIVTDGINGLFCNTSVKSIRSVLQSVIGNVVLREKLGKNARETVLEKYNLKKIVDREIKLLEEVR